MPVTQALPLLGLIFCTTSHFTFLQRVVSPPETEISAPLSVPPPAIPEMVPGPVPGPRLVLTTHLPSDEESVLGVQTGTLCGSA